MGKRGVSKIEGPSTIKLGEEVDYIISRVYRKEDIAKGKYAQWILYVEESGKWRELKRHPNLPPKIGDTTTLVITNQNLVGKKLLFGAYIYSPEQSAESGIIIKVEKGGEKKIEDIQLLMVDEKTPITKNTEMKYGQSILVKVQSVNMQKEKVTIYLYEDDVQGKGHSAKNENNLVAQVEKIFDDNGLITHTFKLPIDFSKIANAYRHHEYYIHVKSKGFSQTSANVKVLNPEYIYQGGAIEEVVLSVKAKGVGADPIPNTGKSVSVVKDNTIEELIDAYFAKKEYTKQTDKKSKKNYDYTFKKDNLNIDKDKIAKIIKNNIDKELLEVKKYCKLESVKNALTKDSYQEGEKISIETYLLDAEFRKIGNAQLGEKMYLVVKSSGLNGYRATVMIREKSPIINEQGSPISLLELSEEYMYDIITDTDVLGTEKTEFSGIVRDNILAIPIQLRPKGDDELQEWKSKLKKDTIPINTYVYLQVKAEGKVSSHEKEFLKQEGEYFKIGGKCPRCEAEITISDFEQMFPNVKQLFYKGTNNFNNPDIKVFLEVLNKTLKEFGINTCIKKAFFLTQITKETGYFSRIDENLYYTTDSALHSFWSKKNHPKLYSNPSDFFRNPEKLANYVYRDIAENGNEASGDGYKYRGRGLIQITRKKGYRRFGEYIGQNLVSNPDLLLQDLDLAIRSAGWYWKHGVLLKNGSEKDLNSVAETGDFKETTRLVHGSIDDVNKREKILSNIKNILKTDECQKS